MPPEGRNTNEKASLVMNETEIFEEHASVKCWDAKCSQAARLKATFALLLIEMYADYDGSFEIHALIMRGASEHNADQSH